MGFSVAATWALQAAAGPLRGRIRTVGAMSGYGNLHAMLRGMVAGEAEWLGKVRRYRPDPYGRWIIGANVLPSLGDATYGTAAERAEMAKALHVLASAAGHSGQIADQPVYDLLIESLERRIAPNARPAWRILAAASGAEPVPRNDARALAEAMADATVAEEPMLDPRGRLDGLDIPVTLFHGHSDRLIPFTESLRPAALLPASVPRTVTISRLIGHTKSRETRRLRNPLTLLSEVRKFERTIDRLLFSLEEG